MELVTGGQLLERLATKGLYSEAVTAQCIRSIAEALAYCHEKGVVHRDLKPENILLSDDTDDATIKLADFGLSKLYNAETEMMFTQCGTPVFVAPEVMGGTGYSMACDIWSLGVMMYIMLCGYEPFTGANITELFDQMMAPASEGGGATPERVELLQDLCETMKYGSLCAMGSMTPAPVETMMKYFPEELARYGAGAEDEQGE